MGNRWVFRSLFLNLGVTSLLLQTLLLRELVVSFYGNEFFVGIVLALWLFWTAVGAFLSGKIKTNSHKLLIILHLLISLLIILSILFIRFFKIPGTTGGETPHLFASLIFVAAVLAPVGLSLGSIFTLGVRIWPHAATAYFWEVLGFLAAGLVFNFFLVTAPALPSRLEFLSQGWRLPDLVQAENSRYGHLAVTKTGDQYNFYESGLLVGAGEDYYAAEFLVHPVLIHHPDPKRVLLIGGGWNGVLAEILKYPSVEKIDYVELDPRFLQVVEKYLSPELKEAFNDPRVKKHFVDGRYFLKHTSSAYDVVIFNLPNPSTALINRFYTRECFAEVKRITEAGGLFALSLSSPTDYLSSETENLLASVYKTLKKEFPEIRVLAEEGVLLVAGKGIKGMKGLRDLKIETKILTDGELGYRLASDKNERMQKLLSENQTAKINSDFYPAAYFYQTLFWQTKFSFVFPKILVFLQQPVVWVLLGLLFSVLGLLFVWRKPSPLNIPNLAVLTVGLGGLTLMATEIILIFLFQTVLGFVYSKIALLLALILGGLAVGNFWGRRSRRFRGTRGELLIIQVLVVCYLCFFLRILPWLSHEVQFYLLGIVAGILVGFIFPPANKLVGEGKGGVLYTADLLGSFFGALLPSLFLIPLFGVQSTVCVLVILNLVGTVLLMLSGGEYFFTIVNKIRTFVESFESFKSL